MTARVHIVVGGGAHARALIATLKRNGASILGFTDVDSRLARQSILGVRFLGSDEILETVERDKVLLVNAIGSIGDLTKRRAIYRHWHDKGFRFAEVVHPQAFCETDVSLGEGSQVMAGAIVQIGCNIGANCIINIGAILDHDCVIEDHVHIAPGVSLSGKVRIGSGTHVGTGASIIQNIVVGENALLAAGCVVVKDVPPGATVAGVPARVLG